MQGKIWSWRMFVVRELQSTVPSFPDLCHRYQQCEIMNAYSWWRRSAARRAGSRGRGRRRGCTSDSINIPRTTASASASACASTAFALHRSGAPNQSPSVRALGRHALVPSLSAEVRNALTPIDKHSTHLFRFDQICTAKLCFPVELPRNHRRIHGFYHTEGKLEIIFLRVENLHALRAAAWIPSKNFVLAQMFVYKMNTWNLLLYAFLLHYRITYPHSFRRRRYPRSFISRMRGHKKSVKRATYGTTKEITRDNILCIVFSMLLKSRQGCK